MVTILDGSSECGAHARSELGNSICLKHLLIQTAASNLEYLHSLTFALHVLNYLLLWVPRARAYLKSNSGFLMVSLLDGCSDIMRALEVNLVIRSLQGI